jgi:hypothetical protein
VFLVSTVYLTCREPVSVAYILPSSDWYCMASFWFRWEVTRLFSIEESILLCTRGFVS